MMVHQLNVEVKVTFAVAVGGVVEAVGGGADGKVFGGGFACCWD